MRYKLVKIGEIGNVITGNTPSKSNKDYYDSRHIPFIKPNNFNIVGITKLFESDEFLSMEGSKVGRIVNKGSVLVTCIGTIGNVGVASQDICFNQQINAIEPNLDIIDNRYLAYSIIYRKKELKAIANAPVVPIINKTQFSAFEIPLPPLEIQKKIVEVLDKAQALIDTRKEQIKLLDDLIQSIFYDMFGDPVANPKGWQVTKIENVVAKEKYSIKAGPFGSALKKEYYVESGYKIYGQEQVIRDDFAFGDYYIDEEKYQELSSCKITSGDILISLVGTFGKISIVPEVFEPGIINPRLMKITLDKEKVNPIFLKSLLSSDTMLNKIQSMSHGGTMGILNTKKIKELEIIVPTYEMQKEYADKKSRIESQKQLMEKSLEQMKNNYNGLMQRAFKGELFS